MEYKEQQRLIYSTALKIGRRSFSTEELNDIAQDVQLHILEQANRGNPFDPSKSSYSTYLYLVTRSVVIDALRVRMRRPELVEFIANKHESFIEDTLGKLYRAEKLEQIYQALETLSDEEQSIAQACLTDTFDLRKYAKEMGISENTAYSRKWRLMKKIAEMMGNKLAA